ncbi:MAG: sterol desaturase family protein [Planctomycetota bacterium]
MKREERRAALVAEIPRSYSGWLHFVAINLATVAAIAGAVYAARGADPRLWLLVLPCFAFANLCEWLFHRGPLHVRTRGLGRLYQRHAGVHHVAFVEGDMAFRASRELALVLFPPYMFPVLLLLTAPVTAALALAAPPLAWVFLASACGYYLVYEWLHLLHHWPQDGWLGRRRAVAWLRRHHARHHDPRRMRAGNFNVSFPLCDYALRSVLPATTGATEEPAASQG